MQCLSRALRNENPKLLTAASTFLLPFQPIMVSAVHTGLMEVSTCRKPNIYNLIKYMFGVIIRVLDFIFRILHDKLGWQPCLSFLFFLFFFLILYFSIAPSPVYIIPQIWLDWNVNIFLKLDILLNSSVGVYFQSWKLN